MDGTGVGPVSTNRPESNFPVQSIGTQSKSATNTELIERRTSQAVVATSTNFLDAYTELEKFIPIQILSDPLLMKAEWAWKQVLFHQMQSFRNETVITSETLHVQSPERNLQVEEAPAGQVAESLLPSEEILPSQLLQVLWDTLASQTLHASDWKTSWTGLVPKTSLLAFKDVTLKDIQTQTSSSFKEWVLNDRLISSVRQDEYERYGQGVFFPESTHSLFESNRREVVRWRASKHTRVTGQGRLIHRVQLELMVKEAPLICTVIASNPLLFIHFSTDHVALRTHLQGGLEALSSILQKHGWQLRQWTISDSQSQSGGL